MSGVASMPMEVFLVTLSLASWRKLLLPLPLPAPLPLLPCMTDRRSLLDTACKAEERARRCEDRVAVVVGDSAAANRLLRRE